MSLNGQPDASREIRGSINTNDTLVVNAYDIAVKNGFNGTEKEWLVSLKAEQKGDKGDKGNPGEDGKDGADGVSVVSVEQTVTSTEPNGNNEITVTLSNGNVSKFYVKNGSVGSLYEHKIKISGNGSFISGSGQLYVNFTIVSSSENALTEDEIIDTLLPFGGALQISCSGGITVPGNQFYIVNEINLMNVPAMGLKNFVINYQEVDIESGTVTGAGITIDDSFFVSDMVRKI